MNIFNLKKISFIFLFIFLLFFFIEIILRILSVEYPIFQKHDSIRGFSLLPNSSGTWNREGKGEIKINDDGLRDINHKISKPDNVLRIAVLGDSFAEARSVNLEETFWYKLKNNLGNCFNLHKGKKIEVINFGVSEYGTTQQYLTLKNNVWQYNPDIILLAFYSGNDISDNVKNLSQKKYRPYFLFKDDKTFDVDNSFLDSKPYKMLSSFLGQVFIKISQYSRISQLLREFYVQQYFKNQKKKKKINDKQNLEIISNLYNPVSSEWLNAWFTTEKILNLINNEIKKNDKDFILVSLTTPIQVNPKINQVEKYKKINNIKDIFYPEKRLNKFSKINSIKFVELAPKMSNLALKNNIYFHGFNNTKLGTGHWNKLGHDQASKLISEKVCSFY